MSEVTDREISQNNINISTKKDNSYLFNTY